VTAKWADLENSLAARVQTETAFASVASTASGGIVPVTAQPAVLLSIVDARTIDRETQINGRVYLILRVSFQAVLSTRMGDAQGASRLWTGGAWELFQKLEAKLLGFTPVLTDPKTQVMTGCVLEDFSIDNLEDAAVDILSHWSVDVQIQN
jgi:hypothetical protein